MRARAGVFILICAAMALWLWMGTTLTPAPAPELAQGAANRVVSLDPGITEVVLSLDATSLLVARPSHTDEFDTIVHLPTVGTGITPNYEGIVRARPDLILTSGDRGTVFDDLSAIAPTIALPWLSVADVASGIRAVGAALDRETAGELLAGRVEQGLADRVTPASPTVLLLIGAPTETHPDLWYIKDNSLHGSALRAAGGKNAISAATMGTASISVERLLQLDPDIVVMMIANPNATDETLVEHRRFWSRLEQLTAVREDRIHFLVGGEHFYTGPGILRLVEALTNNIHDKPGETR